MRTTILLLVAANCLFIGSSAKVKAAECHFVAVGNLKMVENGGILHYGAIHGCGQIAEISDYFAKGTKNHKLLREKYKSLKKTGDSIPATLEMSRWIGNCLRGWSIKSDDLRFVCPKM